MAPPLQAEEATEGRFNADLRRRIKECLLQGIPDALEVVFHPRSVVVTLRPETDKSIARQKKQAAQKKLRSLLRKHFGYLVLPLPPPDPWDD